MPDETVPSDATPSNKPGARSATAAAAAAQRPDRPHGWGADLADKDRPAVPMERRPARLTGVHWETPEQQVQRVEILCSKERPGITPVFGSTLPPRGLSGRLRRFAFGFSESDLRHWLLLLAADRVNVGEGLLSDLASGRIPNVPAEMGIRSELRHNPGGAALKVSVVVGVVGVLYLLQRNRRRRASSHF